MEQILCGNGLVVTDAASGQRLTPNIVAKDDIGNNILVAAGTGPGGDPGYIFFNSYVGTGTIELSLVGYDTVKMDVKFPIPVNINYTMRKSEQPIKPTNPHLYEALVIKGPFPGGRFPGKSNNPTFVDEFDNFDEANQDAALDAYCARGYTSIVTGPIVAKGYHGLYPDTNWLGNKEGFVKWLTKLRQRGLRIVLVLIPDMPPYFYPTDNGVGAYWDLDVIERDLTPFLSDARIQSLVEEVQLAWEPLAPNAEFVKVTAWMKRVFPGARRWIHMTPSHSAPGLSSESIHEADMWHNVVNVGCDGCANQDESRAHPDDYINEEGRTPVEQFTYNTWDFVRHCAGYAGWPVIQYFCREYRAYWEFWNDLPEADQPVDWGTIARQQGCIHIGDGGPYLGNP